MKGDQSDRERAKPSECAHAGDCANEDSISNLAPGLLARPTRLPIDIGADDAQQGRGHQPRPRDIIPTMIPTTSVPAIVPNGLRRAMASSSDANVLACCLADVARSEPVSATPLAASPTCEATASLMLRIVFAASPPACDAKRANVSFKLATSRLSWLKVSPKPSRWSWSASQGAEVDPNEDSGDAER